MLYGIRTTDCVINTPFVVVILTICATILNDSVTKTKAICPCIQVQVTMCVLVIITKFPEAIFSNAT